MKPAFLGFFLFCIASVSLAQVNPVMPGSQPLPTNKVPKKEPQLTPKSDPWIHNFLGFTDIFQKPNLSKQWEEIKFGYNFNPETSLWLDWGYSGLLAPHNRTDAEIWDPEILLDFKLPLRSSKSQNQVSLLTGTSLVLPASPDSVDSSLLAGFSTNLGLEVDAGPWTFLQTNKAYIFAYQTHPVDLPDVPGISLGDSTGLVAVPSSSTQLTYVLTQQMLRMAYKFTDKISGKVEFWYNMSFVGLPLPVETVQFLSTIGYYFTPHFRVFSGFTTSSEIDKGAGPALFVADSTGYRIGIYIQ